jgi:hypothetical protein
MEEGDSEVERQTPGQHHEETHEAAKGPHGGQKASGQEER